MSLDDTTETAKKLIKTGSIFGKSIVIQQVQGLAMPHILSTFSEHGADDLERFIMTDYDLVRNKTPEGVKNLLHNLGSNPKIRQEWEGTILQMVSAENIKHLLKNPDEWMDEEAGEEQIERMQECAEVLETTPGADEWLDKQIYHIYQYANIAPKESTRRVTND